MNELVAVVLLLGAASRAGVLAGEIGEGRICLAPLPENSKAIDHDLPGGGAQRREPRYEFTVQIDALEPVPIPTDGEPQWLPNLAVDSKHLVKIRDAGELIESFYFTFDQRGGNSLCLSYGPWYQSWLLEPPLGRPWCRCGGK